MSVESGVKAILAAMAANLGIAITKFIAFIFSGSSSMLAESVHSLADTGNQVLLLIGGRRAKKGATEEHPFGYGRVRFVYAFVVAIILFSIGGVFSIYEGVHKLQHPEPLELWWLPMLVLVIAIVMESLSFRTALRESAAARGSESIVAYIRHAKAPELPVVLLEDAAALIGLTLAFIGVGLTAITHEGIWDGLGTVAIGILLVAVAIVLGIETKSLLIGEGASRENTDRIVAAVNAGNDVESIIHMKTLYLGPDELMVGMKVAVSAHQTAEDVSRAIDAIERRIREAVPMARVIYIEPDIRRAPAADPRAESQRSDAK